MTAPQTSQTNPPGGRAGDRPGDGPGDGPPDGPGEGAGESAGDGERPGDGDSPAERPGDGIKWPLIVGSISAGGDGEAVKGVSLVSGVFSVDGPVEGGGVE